MAYLQFIDTPINWPDSSQVLVVKKGAGINQLSRQWEKEQVISSRVYLRLMSELNPSLKNVKVGEYWIDENETPFSLLSKLTKGEVIQYAFTIVEGTNSYQVLQQLGKNAVLTQDVKNDPAEVLKQLPIDATSIEGWFYPDTYHFPRGFSSLELLKRATQRMQQVLAEEWQTRALDLPYKNSYEALIMASIIEKETGIAAERERIAGVFVRRLQKRMRLQTDPTVIYGIGPDFNGDITFKDLRTATPYNTYVIKGLPPTPIAMPGRAAIHAALNPADGDELYFVATGDGGHYFSATLEEHNRAVRKYQLKK